MLAVNSNMNQSQSSQNHQSVVDTCNLLNGVEDMSNVCRTCANVTEFVIPIFVDEGLHNNLAQKIQQHLPIKITENDVLPQVVCYQCASTILAWHNLVECCLEADTNFRQRLTSLTSESKSTAKCDQRTEENEANTTKKATEGKVLSLVYDILREYLQVMKVDEENMDIDYVCQICESKPAAKTVDHLVEHLQSSHALEISDCESIQNFIRNNITLEETLKTEDQDDCTSDADNVNTTDIELPAYFCPYCDSAFSSATRLLHHINRHVDISVESGLTCCGENFDKKSFAKHLQHCHVARVVDGPYMCRSCSYSTHSVEELQAHIGEKHVQEIPRPELRRRRTHVPAACPECNKMFSNRHNMLTHLKSHGRTEVFACDKCDKRYRKQSGLREHQRTAHEGVMSHLCAACGEAFPSRAARDVHARLHSGARPYACDYCGKAYRAKNTLDRHIDMHLNIRNYSCRVCDKKFRKSSHLARHSAVHDRGMRSNRGLFVPDPRPRPAASPPARAAARRGKTLT